MDSHWVAKSAPITGLLIPLRGPGSPEMDGEACIPVVAHSPPVELRAPAPGQPALPNLAWVQQCPEKGGGGGTRMATAIP